MNSKAAASSSADEPPFNFDKGQESMPNDVGHRLLFTTRTQISGCLVPFLPTDTTVTLCSPEMTVSVQQYITNRSPSRYAQ